MNVYNQEKTKIITNYDLTLGKLVSDKIITIHHDAIKYKPPVSIEEKVEAIKARGGIVENFNGLWAEITEVFENGARTAEIIEETPAVEAKEAYDEYENILVYIPFTEEELTKDKIRRYEEFVEALIREKYSLSEELSLLRQRDTKIEEFAAYNSYAEKCKIEAKKSLL